MHNRVLLTHKARMMLKQHIIFLSQVSIPAAEKLTQIFQEYIELLRSYSKIGKVINFNSTFKHEYRKLVISKRYIIIYFLNKNCIYIAICTRI